MGRRWHCCSELLTEDVQIVKYDHIFSMEGKDWSPSAQHQYKTITSCNDNSPPSSPSLPLHQKQSDSAVSGKQMAREACIPSDSGSDYEDSEDSITEGESGISYPSIIRSQSPLTNHLHSLYPVFQKSKSTSTTSENMISASISNIPVFGNPSSIHSSSPSISSLHISQNNPGWILSARGFKDIKIGTSEVSDPNDEQPLDLSTKSSSTLDSPTESHSEDLLLSSPTNIPPLNFTQSIATKVPILNTNKHIFKAKPRLSPSAGRRSYTEQELQAALRDIQSGKLGTRRAAVIYNIPRSTLRNKVYKLAMEKERDSGIYPTIPTDTDDDRRIEESDTIDDSEDKDDEDEDVDKELYGPEEDKDLVEKSTESLRALLQHGSKFFIDLSVKQEENSSPPVTALPPQFPPPSYPMFPPSATEIWGGIDPMMIRYLSQLMPATRENLGLPTLTHPFDIKNQISGESPPLSNFGIKFPAPIFPELVHRMMEERILLEEQQRKMELDNTDRKTEQQSFARTDKLGERSDARSSSLKYRYKNGSSLEKSNSGCLPDYPVVSEDSEKSATQSPSPGRYNSDSSSPPIISNRRMSLRDVIAKSISQRFQQPHDFQQHIPTTTHCPTMETFRRFPLSSSGVTSYNSVIKSHNSSNVIGNQSEDRGKITTQSGSSSNSTCVSASVSGVGGKGTRPKRGKYRNYDRDSLVEAVRAVQRGEMSVHRAGSYYGVPHSTLEYKVKERHLMRPRKREPKNQDDLKNREDGSVLRLASTEKSTLQSIPHLPKVTKPSFSPQSPIPNTPNGMKIPTIFDPSTSNPFNSANPFPFWPPNPFHQMALDYPRNATFPPGTEHILASHFVQRIHEESSKNPEAAQTANITAALGRSAREVAESLYEGSSGNASFLDGIIRSSLETSLVAAKESERVMNDNIPRKTFLEQLYRRSLAKMENELNEPINVRNECASTVDTTTNATDRTPVNAAERTSTNATNRMSPESSPLEVGAEETRLSPKESVHSKSENENDCDKKEHLEKVRNRDMDDGN